MSNVSLERYYFVLYDGALTLKMSKMALLTRFAIKLFIYRNGKWIQDIKMVMEIAVYTYCSGKSIMESQGILKIDKCLNTDDGVLNY